LTSGHGAASKPLDTLDTGGSTASACVLHSSRRSVACLGQPLTPFLAAQENRCAHIVVPLKSLVALEPAEHSLSEFVV
jgi:hypothetical protein